MTGAIATARATATAYLSGETPHKLARAILIAMLTIDALFILAHLATGVLLVVVETDRTDHLHRLFNLFHDDSLPEHFNFVKWTMLIVFLLAAFIQSRSRAAPWLCTAFAALLLDDAGEGHEHIGDWLAEGPLVGLGDVANAVVELIVFALLALLLIALLWQAFRRVTPAERPVLVGMIVTLVVLALFGVGIDAVHSIASARMGGLVVDQSLGVIEDGGELAMITVLCICGLRFLQVGLASRPG